MIHGRYHDVHMRTPVTLTDGLNCTRFNLLNDLAQALTALETGNGL